jgi:hypothetical protein
MLNTRRWIRALSRSSRGRTFLAALLLLSGLPFVRPRDARADEGMWMPQQIPALASRLKALGFQGDPNAFADLTGDPMGAVVSIPGCSASFVSQNGLIVTNHHCAVGFLQFNSTPERNLLRDGFLARSTGEELWSGPGSRVLVTASFREVTDEIVGGIEGKTLTDRKRFDLIERRIKEKTAACEKNGARCRIESFFEGLRYFEISQTEIQDVRLVYAPAEGIGVFGGETDNWQWPRHTGDWTFIRAYVDKNGKPAPFSKDNVPYRPKHWLKFSTEGASPGDIVFVAGSPGRTERHQTLAEVREAAEFTFPRVVKRSEDSLAILEEVSKGSPETAIKVSSLKARLGNALTNRRGMLSGFLKGGLLAKKEASEKELAEWIAKDPVRQKELGDVLPALRALQLESEKTRERDSALLALYGASTQARLTTTATLLASANTIHRMSVERARPDLDRTAEFQERNWSHLRDAQDRLEKSLDVKADRALFRYALVQAAALPNDQRIPALDRAAKLSAAMTAADAAKAIDAFLDPLYAGTRLMDRKTRLQWFDAKTAEVAAVKDPFLELARSLDPLMDEIREREKTMAGARARVRPRYMKALLAKNGGLVAPDANNTLRVTFGKVQGVVPHDGMVYTPQTTLKGVTEKNTGTGDFAAPH